jgi:outer membrane lipoprotein SlyB
MRLTDVKPKQQNITQDPVKKAKETVNEVSKKGMKGGTGAMMGAAAGAVAGATLGGIAGAALTDENTRKTVSEKLSQLAKTAGETVKKLDANSDKLKKNMSETSEILSDSAEPLSQVGKKK